ncbi:Ovarian tumor, otubain [Kalmanozyma brasiliensis GHG001]|nr:Ovarian tumor, otubain [Kalmanozyma brasiliensis GHG001]EST08255.2 Ovarian tumor, otubain [Kalmanozyma brasiliensis GHG001]
MGIKFIKKERYLANFKNLLHRAQELGVFRGKATKQAGPTRKHIIYDLGLAMGWNPGLRNNIWTFKQPQWWTWVPSTKDIDDPPEVQPTSNLKFKDPLSKDTHLEEIERCVKMYKRGTLWRSLIYNEGGKKVPFGSAQTQLKLANLIWTRFKYDWTTSCYLEKTPFKEDDGTHQGTSQPPKKLDQDLDKYKIKGTHMVPEGTFLAELQGTTSYRMTSGYIKADGNCQFRVLSKIIYGTQNRHLNVRTEVVKYLEHHQNMVEAILATKEIPAHPLLSRGQALTFRTYLTQMARVGTWGDDATLSAAVSIFNLSLVIINPDRSYFEVNKVNNPPQWHALYYTGNHYELVLKFNPRA